MTRAEVFAAPADVTSEQAVRDVVAKIRDRFGRINILVNNASGDIGTKGVTGERAGKPVVNDGVEVSLEDVRIVLDRNLMSCILVCHEVVPEMIERNAGWIVSVGSIAGLSGHPSEVIYGTAKAAMHEYTRCASRPAAKTAKSPTGALTRYGWPAKIARTVELLVTDDSSYITGQVLRVDGGAQIVPAKGREVTWGYAVRT